MVVDVQYIKCCAIQEILLVSKDLLDEWEIKGHTPNPCDLTFMLGKGSIKRARVYCTRRAVVGRQCTVGLLGMMHGLCCAIT